METILIELYRVWGISTVKYQFWVFALKWYIWEREPTFFKLYLLHDVLDNMLDITLN